MTTEYVSPENIIEGGTFIENPKPLTSITIGRNPRVEIAVDKKFNWFQKKMIKWCFGFEVKENK